MNGNTVMSAYSITADLGIGYAVKSTDMADVIAYVDAQFGDDVEIVNELVRLGVMNILRDEDGSYLVDTDGALLIG